MILNCPPLSSLYRAKTNDVFTHLHRLYTSNAAASSFVGVIKLEKPEHMHNLSRNHHGCAGKEDLLVVLHLSFSSAAMPVCVVCLRFLLYPGTVAFGKVRLMFLNGKGLD